MLHEVIPGRQFHLDAHLAGLGLEFLHELLCVYVCRKYKQGGIISLFGKNDADTNGDETSPKRSVHARQVSAVVDAVLQQSSGIDFLSRLPVW